MVPYERGMPDDEEPLDPTALRRTRVAAVSVLALGLGGIAMGCVLPEAGTELLVGSVLVVLSIRALLLNTRR